MVVQVLRDVLRVCAGVEAEDRIGLEVESTQLGHGWPDEEDE